MRSLFLSVLAGTVLSLMCSCSLFKADTNVRDYEGHNSMAIQNAIDDCPKGGTVYIPAGTYSIVTPVKLKSDITIKGDGAGTILLADEKLNDTGAQNAFFSSSGAPDGANVYGDANITLQGITFDGDRMEAHRGGLLSLVKAKNITITDCTFRNSIYIAVGLAGCNNVIVRGCLFENNGLPKPAKESTPALWTDSAMGNDASNIIIEDSTFQNNNWSGCYFMPSGGRIARCRFINNGESSIYTNYNGYDLQYIDNYITGARMSNISCCGIEIAGSKVVVEGNLIENCGDAGIALTNSEDAVVRDNMILNNGQERGPSGPTGVCLFSLGITVPDRERETRNILIEDNIIGNIETMRATQANAISGWKSADGALFRNITFKDNIYGTRTKCVNINSGYLGENCVFSDNREMIVTEEMREAFIRAMKKRINNGSQS